MILGVCSDLDFSNKLIKGREVRGIVAKEGCYCPIYTEDRL